jgi:hypothetical protein
MHSDHHRSVKHVWSIFLFCTLSKGLSFICTYLQFTSLYYSLHTGLHWCYKCLRLQISVTTNSWRQTCELEEYANKPLNWCSWCTSNMWYSDWYFTFQWQLQWMIVLYIFCELYSITNIKCIVPMNVLTQYVCMYDTSQVFDTLSAPGPRTALECTREHCALPCTLLSHVSSDVHFNCTCRLWAMF